MRSLIPKKIQLHIGISTAFMLLMIPSILGLIWFVYMKNSASIDVMAEQSMSQVSSAAIEHSADLLNPVSNMVSTIVGIGERDPAMLAKPETRTQLFHIIRTYPQIYSLYVGFQDTGNFVETVRIPAGQVKFGPNQTPVPKGAEYVLRYLDRTGPTPGDHYLYVTADGTPVFEEQAAKIVFDPRTRPFYAQALATPDAVAVSDIYGFASTGKPGITISRAIHGADGRVIAAAGANLTIDNISDFLRRHAPSEHGIALIIDDHGKLVAHPDPTKVVRQSGSDLVINAVADIGVPTLSIALAGHQFTGLPARKVYYDDAGNEYIASFTPFPASFGKKWELLLAVPTDDFVGTLKRTTTQVLLIGLGVLVVGILAMRRLAAALTKPIDLLIDEADRIRSFDLDGEIGIKSSISEITDLSNAMGTMKTALQSFGHFVPKTLVRDLVATGRKITLGGEARRITVLFTDLANFSSLAETVTPQELTERVSDYLEDVSQECTRFRGTIDKYIGDAVMALWNAPNLDDQHIYNACRAALTSQKRLARSNLRWAEKGWKPISMRVGLHTDNVVVGIIGSTEHMSYTALGDGVNIASRLEGINKNYGTGICVSDPIEREMRMHYLMRPLDNVAVKGRKEPILIYELMGSLDGDVEIAATEDDIEKAEMTRVAFAAWLRGDFVAARGHYTDLLRRFPGDPVAKLYLTRCDEAESDVKQLVYAN